MCPRVLLSYNTLKDSEVLNRGQLQLGDHTVVGCTASDQRGKTVSQILAYVIVVPDKGS